MIITEVFINKIRAHIEEEECSVVTVTVERSAKARGLTISGGSHPDLVLRNGALGVTEHAAPANGDVTLCGDEVHVLLTAVERFQDSSASRHVGRRVVHHHWRRREGHVLIT